MITITNNKNPSLLEHFKKINDSKRRLPELENLIDKKELKNFELNPAQLKAFLPLFPKRHLHLALIHLAENFAIIVPNTKELKDFLLGPTQLITTLSLLATRDRFSTLQALIKLFSTILSNSKELRNLELNAPQLKAILFLFNKIDRFNALKLLVKNFDIKVHLTESDIKELEICLSRDPAFNDLLPFAKKKIWDDFFVKDEKLPDAHSMQSKIKPISPALKDFRGHTLSNQSKPSQKKAIVNRNKLTLAELRLSLIKERPESRLNIFNCSAIKNAYQAIIVSIDLEAFKNFIEIFPPKDVIKFLNLPMIKNQMEGLHRQNGQLSKESYIDLLNYFEPHQKDSVKKLLRPISPIIDANLLSRGIFKKRMGVKGEHANLLPDIVSSAHAGSRAK